MFDQLISRWWIVAMRGIVAVMFGMAAFAAPDRTLGVLIALFGLFAFADGFFTIGAGLAMNWLLLFLEGVLGTVVGLMTVFFPALTAVWFGELMVAWALATGALELLGAYTLHQMGRRRLLGEWLLALSGDLSVAFGVLVAILTSASPSFMAVVGGYALFSGGLLVALAFNIRTWPRLSAA